MEEKRDATGVSYLGAIHVMDETPVKIGNCLIPQCLSFSRPLQRLSGAFFLTLALKSINKHKTHPSF